VVAWPSIVVTIVVIFAVAVGETDGSMKEEEEGEVVVM